MNKAMVYGIVCLVFCGLLKLGHTLYEELIETKTQLKAAVTALQEFEHQMQQVSAVLELWDKETRAIQAQTAKLHSEIYRELSTNENFRDWSTVVLPFDIDRLLPHRGSESSTSDSSTLVERNISQRASGSAGY